MSDVRAGLLHPIGSGLLFEPFEELERPGAIR
jgi:hypothetical protein